MYCINDASQTELKWVEGIGSLYLPLDADLLCAVDINRDLVCFYQNGHAIYSNDRYDTCWLSTSTDNSLPNYLTLYPNPVTDWLQIDGLTQPTRYTLYNAPGQTVRTEQTTDRIDCQSLPAGLYNLTLWLEGVPHTSRVVKR